MVPRQAGFKNKHLRKKRSSYTEGLWKNAHLAFQDKGFLPASIQALPSSETPMDESIPWKRSHDNHMEQLI